MSPFALVASRFSDRLLGVPLAAQTRVIPLLLGPPSPNLASLLAFLALSVAGFLVSRAAKLLFSFAAGLLALSVAAFLVFAMFGWAGGVPRSA